MTSLKSDRSIGIWIIAVLAIGFGLLTIKSGGTVLFVDGIARADAGEYENRTVAAMSLRTVVWASIAIFAYRKILRL